MNKSSSYARYFIPSISLHAPAPVTTSTRRKSLPNDVITPPLPINQFPDSLNQKKHNSTCLKRIFWFMYKDTYQQFIDLGPTENYQLTLILL